MPFFFLSLNGIPFALPPFYEFFDLHSDEYRR